MTLGGSPRRLCRLHYVACDMIQASHSPAVQPQEHDHKFARQMDQTLYHWIRGVVLPPEPLESFRRFQKPDFIGLCLDKVMDQGSNRNDSSPSLRQA